MKLRVNKIVKAVLLVTTIFVCIICLCVIIIMHNNGHSNSENVYSEYISTSRCIDTETGNINIQLVPKTSQKGRVLFLAGNAVSGEPLSDINITFIQDRDNPDGEMRAVLWNCAYINDGKVEERDEYIYGLAGYAWAARNKEEPALWIEDASVRSEESYHYSSDNELRSVEKYIYDMDGNKIPVLFYVYDDDGNISYGIEYDEKGNWLANYSYNSDGSIFYHEKNEYDEAGNLSVSYEYYTEGYIYRDEYMYDSNGKRVGCYEYYMDSEGEFLDYYWESEYDSNGNLTVCRYYDGKGVLTRREEYTYDENGNELFNRYYDGDGMLEISYETEYDVNGNKVASSKYGKEGLEYKHEYKYDTHGNCTGFYAYDQQGLLKDDSWEHEYKYDEDGNLAAVYCYNGDGLLTETMEYKYDEDRKQRETCWYENGIMTDRNIGIFDAEWNLIKDFEYQDGELKSRTICEYNENGECTRYYRYDGKGSLKKIMTYDYVYEYDAVGGMKIYYYYVNGALRTKTITVFY